MSRYSERVYSILCSLVGDKDAVSYKRSFSDVYVLDLFEQPLKSVSFASIENIITNLYPETVDSSAGDGLRQALSMYRIFQGVIPMPLPQEYSQIVDHLPELINSLPKWDSVLSNAVQMLQTMEAQLPMAMRHSVAPQIRQINNLHAEWTRKTENIKREIDPKVYMSKFEEWISMLKESVTLINSGSRAEGFDFITSDFDIMLTTQRVKVLPSMPPGIDTQSDNVLLMEKENTRPGFVRLFATQDPGILMFLFSNLGNKYYLSNRLLKIFALDVSRMDITNISLHGPCLSTEHEMTDLALTLSSNSWSNDAIGCVHRMLKRGWPPEHIVQEMVKDGFLFVPIGCRFSQHEDVEWRMSFSLAEKRLVHSMNHTQFLVYALLKLFLKGVVEQNAEVKGLLCSYFMKTSVFWEIMEAKTPWNPSNLLLHFWNCFRRLLNWVKNGYCPNFFIPENNMFFGKIHGDAQQKLLKYLGSLHGEGHAIIKKISMLMFEFDKWTGVQTHGIHHGLKRSQVILDLTTTFSFGCGRSAETLLQALGSEKSEIVSECCQFLRLSEINLSCNRKLFEQSTLDDCNKVKYMKERSIIRVLMLSSPDCIRSRMFLAMYFYKCKRYDRALRLLYSVLQKYEDPETFNTFPFNQIGFDGVGGEVLSIPEGMRRHSICQIPFESTTCISEIFDEFSYSNIAHECQVVPPLPLVHFILFLSHFQMEDLAQARIHLMELENHNNHRMEEYLELLDLRRPWRLSKEAISWELLGIGHEVIGDFRKSLKSLRMCNRILLSNRAVSAINLRLFEANKRRIKRIEETLEKS